MHHDYDQDLTVCPKYIMSLAVPSLIISPQNYLQPI